PPQAARARASTARRVINRLGFIRCSSLGSAGDPPAGGILTLVGLRGPSAAALHHFPQGGTRRYACPDAASRERSGPHRRSFRPPPPRPRGTGEARRRDPPVHPRSRLPHRRPPVAQPRGGGADARPAPGVRLAP